MKTKYKTYVAEVSEWLEEEISHLARAEGVSEGELLLRVFIRYHARRFARAMGLRSAGLAEGSRL